MESATSFSVRVIPCFDDNFCYYVSAPGEEKTGIFVDVGDAAPVIEFIKDNGITPSAILSTHKHWDHTGGNVALKTEFPDL